MSQKMRGTPTDTGWAWVVVIGLSMSFMIVAGFVRGFGIFYAALVDEFGGSAAMTSLIQGFRFAALCISAPIFSSLTERYTERAVLLFGSSIFSLALILSYFAPNLEFTVFTLGLMTGVGMAGFLTPAQIAVGKYFDKYRSLANSICFCGSSFGMMSLPPLVMYLIRDYGLRGALLIYGGLLLNGLVGAALVRPFRKRDTEVVSVETRPLTVDTRASNPPPGHEDEPLSGGDTENPATAFPLDNELRSPSETKAPSEAQDKGGELRSPNSAPAADSNGNVQLDLHEKYANKIIDTGQTSPGLEMPLQNPHLKTDKDVLRLRSLSSISEMSDMHLYTSYASLQCVDGSMHLTFGRQLSDIETGKANSSFSESSSKRTGVLGFFSSCIDFSLFRNVRYVLFLISTCVGIIGFANITIYLIPRAEEYNVSRDKAALFLTIAGGCDILGRLLLGVVSDVKKIGPHRVMGVGLVIIAIATMLLPLSKNFTTMTVYVVIFGLLGSSGHLLCLPIVVLFVGKERMPRAMGLVISFHGIASALSPPILGYLKDITGTYDSTFYVCGVCQLLAGLLMLLEPLINRCRTQSYTDTQGNDKREQES